MQTFPVRPAEGRKCGVTIGNFDGVHLGHRLLVRRTLELCHANRLDCVAMTFWPHPRALFSGHAMPPLADKRTRRELLGRLGVDYLVELNFTSDIAALSPEEFYRFHLAPLDMELLVVGYDFCLGKNRTGDFAELTRLGKQHGFSVYQVPPLLHGASPISSSRIRKAIEDGDMREACAMLGRPHALLGMVIHGEGRGTTLGFPTANLDIPDVLLPPDGVYATRVRCGDKLWPAVTNVGFNPTFGGTTRTVESFLLDCDVNLYGEEVCVEFLERLRGEKHFAKVDDLVAQIAKDVEDGRRINRTFTEASFA